VRKYYSSGNIIPTIALSALNEGPAERHEMAQAVDKACREIGFFLVTSDDMPLSLISDVYEASKTFFTRPLHEKSTCRSVGSGILGYRAANTLRASTSSSAAAPFDLKELFSIGTEVPAADWAESFAEYYPKNLWPENLDCFRYSMLNYYNEMGKISAKIGEIFQISLNLPSDFFSSRSKCPVSLMSSIYYPISDTAHNPDQLRFGAHRDRSCFTILSTTGAGLEVQDCRGGWHAVPAVPGAFIINVGSMLANWTGKRWVAPMHRVSLASIEERNTSNPRQTIVFFYSPDPNVLLDTMSSPEGESIVSNATPPTVAEYMRSMFDLYR
jgi:isopenicillin N synthase-like dioxygenase